MKLKVLGSSSRGNGYVIQDENEALIIEAGVSLAKAKQALDFNISKVAGVLISHSHCDHAKYSRDYQRVFDIFTHSHVIESNELVRATEILADKKFRIGNFNVYPIQAHHDVPCYAFHISHPKIGNLLFVTDSFMFDYSMSNLNHVMIECNYVDDIINFNVENNIIHPKVRDRVLMSHMELQTTIRTLSYQDLSKVDNIILLHLSGDNSDPELMKDTVIKKFGRPVAIAKPGLSISISINPF
jgi:phosphoribosyl 1,2-cyclic phosphodiesterase